MSEFDVPETDLPQNDWTLPQSQLRSDEEFGELAISEPTPAAREGLPPSYRMRADRHYIERMSDSVGMPVRLIPVDQIERIEQSGARPVPASDPLARSIAAHGVLQPLLVFKRNGGYKLIAGRRRLAAASAVGLAAVPCLVHDVSEAEAASLADAENIRGASPDSSLPRVLPINVADVLQEIASDLVRLERSAALLRHVSGGFAYQKTAVDLIAAQTWRTSWVANATALMLGERRPAGRPRSFAVIVERVLQGFEPELRLSGGHLQANVTIAPSVVIDAALGELALTGAIFATLHLLQAEEQPVVDVRVGAPGKPGNGDNGVVVVDVVQQHVEVPPDVARGFTDTAPAAKGHLVIGLAASVLREIAARYRGSVAIASGGVRGGVVRCTFRV